MSPPVPDLEQPYVRAVGAYAFATPQGGLLRAGPDAAGEAVPTFVAELLLGIQDLAPLPVHAARFANRAADGFFARARLVAAAGKWATEAGFEPTGPGPAIQRVLTGILAGLAQRGHLQARPAFASALAALDDAAPTRITCFTVPTANRPQGLERALESYLPHFAARGRSLRVVVGDDSKDPAVVTRNREVIERARRHGLPIEHLDRAARQALAEAHAAGDAQRRKALAPNHLGCL